MQHLEMDDCFQGLDSPLLFAFLMLSNGWQWNGHSQRRTLSQYNAVAKRARDGA